MTLSKNQRYIVFGIVIVIITGVTATTAYSLHLFDTTGRSGRPCPSSQASSFSSANYTIIITNQGFNGSRTYAQPCPVLNVRKGQTVTIHLENIDPVETHGFAVTHYLDSGVLLAPGQKKDVVFTVTQSGTFLIYCNVICSIHLYMQDGRLNVT